MTIINNNNDNNDDKDNDSMESIDDSYWSGMIIQKTWWHIVKALI